MATTELGGKNAVLGQTTEDSEVLLSDKKKEVSGIQNKMRRRAEFKRIQKTQKKAKQVLKKKMKKERKIIPKDVPPKEIPKTIESLRIPDDTMITEEDEEVEFDVDHDELETYFSKIYEPKVLITCADNPHRRTLCFMKELSRVIPNSQAFQRNDSSVKKMVKQCVEKGYTDIVIINENMRVPNGLLVIHLPDGPTALFRLSNVKVTRDLKKHWKGFTSHRPEVILNKFKTRLGHSVGRMLAALFHFDPQFRGRQVVTFHNQRDYIFFRYHRYEFENGKKVKLKELGPRFTLKLRSLQKGAFDSKFGEYEWKITGKRHEMETSRRKFFL